MRRSHAIAAVLLACCCYSATPAVAEPPPGPVLPSLPGLPTIPAFGVPLPSLPELIDGLIPPPPLPPAPADSALGQTVPGASPDFDALRSAVMPTPVGDPIFDAWPANLAELEPGQLIEVRDVTATAALFVLVPVRQVLVLKFRTTDATGDPSFATATLVLPAAPWPGTGSRPVVVNNLPINGLGRACTPSYTMAHGLTLNFSFNSLVPPTTQLAALRGYAVLIPDHEGPRMAYGEPYAAGHAVLDAIRATRGYLPNELGASRFAMTGYSGGAIATHGAVKLIDSYAPELGAAIVGAALGGVPADFEILSRTLNGNVAASIFMAATFGVGRERPEILAAMNHLAQWVATSPMKDQCIGVIAASGVHMLPIDVAANIEAPLQSELAQQVFRETKMAGMKSGTPLLIYNGEQEWWIPAEGARNLYNEQCALGVNAIYRSVFGEHLIGAVTGYPGALDWLDQRLRGVPAPSEC